MELRILIDSSLIQWKELRKNNSQTIKSNGKIKKLKENFLFFV